MMNTENWQALCELAQEKRMDEAATGAKEFINILGKLRSDFRQLEDAFDAITQWQIPEMMHTLEKLSKSKSYKNNLQAKKVFDSIQQISKMGHQYDKNIVMGRTIDDMLKNSNDLHGELG